MPLNTRSLLIVAAAALAGAAVPMVAAGNDADDADRIAAVTRPATDFSKAEPYELNPGGGATSFKPLNASAFSHPSANMSFERQLDFRVGDGIFRKLWVSAPSSTRSSDGLGPLWNARACQNCHLKDGRGRPPAVGEAPVSMFLRLSIPPRDDADRATIESGRAAVIAEPTYGTQFQTFSIQGHLAEGRLEITHEEIPVALADGEVAILQKPLYALADLNYGPLHPETMISPRVAPPMIGMGLLEAIPEDAILARADPDDADGDGISGRPNRAWDPAADALALGRFGWKAGAPTVAAQSAGAFAGDMGLSSPLVPAHWGDCTEAQETCRTAAHGIDDDDDVEVPPRMFDLVAFYARHLAVPARRDIDDPDVLAGKRIFYESGCVACHTPKFVTARDPNRPEHSFQLIWPYTDLLLHDMGEGLADGRPEGFASGREWRTPPLWGLGLTETVSDHTRLLHDGRARNVLEAILWHGGEAQASRDKVVALNRKEREALLRFMDSL